MAASTLISPATSMQHARPRAFRATVAAFNGRALAAFRRAGFVPAAAFERPADRLRLIVLLRSAADF